jgi:beta-N-acetylhexosaminidase
MFLKRAAIFFIAAFAFVQAEDSSSEVQFIPLNSLTESVANQVAEPASSSTASAPYTAEALPQNDSEETPYGLPAELCRCGIR